MLHGLGGALLVVGGTIAGMSILLVLLAHIDPNTRRESMLSKIVRRRHRVVEALEDAVPEVLDALPTPERPALPADT